MTGNSHGWSEAPLVEEPEVDDPFDDEDESEEEDEPDYNVIMPIPRVEEDETVIESRQSLADAQKWVVVGEQEVRHTRRHYEQEDGSDVDRLSDARNLMEAAVRRQASDKDGLEAAHLHLELTLSVARNRVREIGISNYNVYMEMLTGKILPALEGTLRGAEKLQQELREQGVTDVPQLPPVLWQLASRMREALRHPQSLGLEAHTRARLDKQRKEKLEREREALRTAGST